MSAASWSRLWRVPGAKTTDRGVVRLQTSRVKPRGECISTAGQVGGRLVEAPSRRLERCGARGRNATSGSTAAVATAVSFNWLKSFRHPPRCRLEKTVEQHVGELDERMPVAAPASSERRKPAPLTLDAAEVVADAELDTLQSLVEKSLLRFANERYWMLETIREYGRERLGYAREASAFDRRHALHFLARVEQEHAARTGPGRAQCFRGTSRGRQPARDVDRLAVAAPAEAARAAHMLFMFWRSLGAYSEAVQRLRLLLPRELPDDLRAQTLADLAEAQEARGDLDAASTTAAEALRLSSPGTHARVVALLIASSSEILTGNVVEGICFGRRAAVEAKSLDAEIRIATLGDLAMLLVQAGRREEARSVLRDAVEDARRSGLRMNAEWGSGQLGFVDLLDGDYEAACSTLAPVLTYARSVDHYPFEASMLHWLGFSYLGIGQRDAARASFGDLLELSSGSSKTITPEFAAAMCALALAVEQVDSRDGARLHGAIEKLREETGGLRTPMWREEREIEARFEQPLIDALGEDAYAHEHAIGAAMTRDEAIDLAQSLVERPAAARVEQAPSR